MRHTVVLIHPGALGDVLLAVASIRRIRREFPQHEIVLCAGRPVAGLLLDCGEIDGWLPVEGTACVELFSRTGIVSGRLKDWLSRCDLAVAWMRDDEKVVSQNLRRCGAAKVRVESPASTRLQACHQSDRFLEIAAFPPSDSSTVPVLSLSNEMRARGSALLREQGLRTDQPLALIHHGSGSHHKCVTPELLGAVITSLENEGLRPLILEGPADGKTVNGLILHVSSRIPVIRELELCSVSALLAHMRLFIGHDSGITHLAALLGVPTIALFGPTDPARWAPRGSHVTVLQAEPCRCRSWDQVMQCRDKPCLRLSVEAITAAGLKRSNEAANPRNPSQSALSPPTPYVRVAS